MLGAGSEIHPHERCPRRQDGSPAGGGAPPPRVGPSGRVGPSSSTDACQARSERSQQRESLPFPLAVDLSGSGSLCFPWLHPFMSLIQHTFSEGLAGPSLVLSLGRQGDCHKSRPAAAAVRRSRRLTCRSRPRAMGTIPLYPAWREGLEKVALGQGGRAPWRRTKCPGSSVPYASSNQVRGTSANPGCGPTVELASGSAGNPAGLEVAGMSALSLEPPPWMTVGHWPSRKEALWVLEASRSGQKEGPLSRGLVMAAELASGARLHRCFGNIEGRGRQPGDSCPSYPVTGSRPWSCPACPLIHPPRPCFRLA